MQELRQAAAGPRSTDAVVFEAPRPGPRWSCQGLLASADPCV